MSERTADDMVPPMPVRAEVYGTVRHDDTVVARVVFADVVGDTRTLDFQVDTALALAGDLIAFVRQVREGRTDGR